MQNKLRVLRAEKKWSQAELADRLGVSRQAVNAVETGKHDPSLTLAFSIADVFEQTIEDIFESLLGPTTARNLLLAGGP
jgi:putative transcriptional regulator